MQVGRKPKPIGLKVLQGTASRAEKERFDKQTCGGLTEAGTPCGLPAGWGTSRRSGPCKHHEENELVAPGFLPKNAQELWNQLAPHLASTGRLEPEHVPAMTNLCLAWHMVLDAGLELSEDGLVDVDQAHGKRKRKHPAWQMWRDAQTAFRAWCTEFGLTPSSKVRIAGLVDGEQAPNPFAEFRSA